MKAIYKKTVQLYRTSVYKSTTFKQHESTKYSEIANKLFSWALVH